MVQEIEGNTHPQEIQEKARYARIIRLVGSNPAIQLEERDFFSPKDILGKAWLRLRMEVRAIEKDPEEIFPPDVTVGFISGANAIAALWFYTSMHQLENRAQIARAIRFLSQEERTEIEKFTGVCAKIVRHRLPKDDYALRFTLGMLRTSLQGILSDQSEKVQGDFNRGVDIVFARWRELSSQA